jgi:hypothetical protein
MESQPEVFQDWGTFGAFSEQVLGVMFKRPQKVCDAAVCRCVLAE